MNSKRQSTNVKLAAIIHANADDTPEAEEDMKQLEKLAKQRLRRACLYGGGARTKVPKIKKTSKKITGDSPFCLPGAPRDPLSPQKLATSVPPCAHEQQFLLVRNPTRSALNDPDRYCYNTSSMVDGVRPLPQPPWYVGYENKTVPSDSHMAIASARYGHRGSQQIEQYNTAPYAHPSKTRTENTPTFLRADDNFVDEWVPPIIAATVDTINGIETPKLWPENATYVSGYKKKTLPSSWRYKRETTVDLQERPQSPAELTRWMSTCNSEQQQLRTAAFNESRKLVKSLPLTTKDKIAHRWQNYVNRDANNSLRESLRQVHAPYEPHTLLDASDSMRYSGSTALIVHTQSTEELKFRMRMESSKSKVNTPHQLKWQHVIGHYRNIERKLKRGQKMTAITKRLVETMHEVALRSGSETSLRRAEFMQACHRTTLFEDVGDKLVSQMFGLFDPMKKDTLRFVELIYMFALLDNPDQDAVDKFLTLWDLSQRYGLDRNAFDLVFEILACPAASLSDVSEIETLFKSQFRVKCYEYATNGGQFRHQPSRRGSSRATDRSSTASVPATASSTRAATPLSPLASRPASPNDPANTSHSAPVADSAPANSRRSAALQHQYNICDQYMNEESLREILLHCPDLLETFDNLISKRLVQCYGLDVRRVAEEEAPIDTSNLDFSWIMKREAPKRATFGLFE